MTLSKLRNWALASAFLSSCYHQQHSNLDKARALEAKQAGFAMAAVNFVLFSDMDRVMLYNADYEDPYTIEAYTKRAKPESKLEWGDFVDQALESHVESALRTGPIERYPLYMTPLGPVLGERQSELEHERAISIFKEAKQRGSELEIRAAMTELPSVPASYIDMLAEMVHQNPNMRYVVVTKNVDALGAKLLATEIMRVAAPEYTHPIDVIYRSSEEYSFRQPQDRGYYPLEGESKGLAIKAWLAQHGQGAADDATMMSRGLNAYFLDDQSANVRDIYRVFPTGPVKAYHVHPAIPDRAFRSIRISLSRPPPERGPLPELESRLIYPLPPPQPQAPVTPELERGIRNLIKTRYRLLISLSEDRLAQQPRLRQVRSGSARSPH